LAFKTYSVVVVVVVVVVVIVVAAISVTKSCKNI
jgi:hypothetical protein